MVLTFNLQQKLTIACFSGISILQQPLILYHYIRVHLMLPVFFLLTKWVRLPVTYSTSRVFINIIILGLRIAELLVVAASSIASLVLYSEYSIPSCS